MAPDPPLDALLVSPPMELAAPALYTLNLAAGLTAAGKRVVVVTPGGPLMPPLKERGVEIEEAAYLETPVIGWFQARRVVKAYRRAGVAVVHAQGSGAIPEAARLARGLGAPLVVSIHRFSGAQVDHDWSGVAAIIVVGDALREDVVNRRRAPRDRVHVVPGGIELGYEPLPPFAHGTDPVIGTLGEADKPRAQVAFLRAAAEVLKRVPEAQFLVIGGAQPKRLRRLIRQLGIVGNVTFTPVMDQRKALPVMDICVLPSVEEGPAHALLEAMAAARPVIAVGAGGAFSTIQDEETGLLVEKKNDPARLSEAVLRLLEDRDLARRMGLRARAVASERYPLDRMLDETLQIYRKAAGA